MSVMQTFRVEDDSLQRKRMARCILLACGTLCLGPATVALLLVLNAYGLVPKDSSIATWVIETGTLGSVIGSFALALRAAYYRLERKMVFFMDKDGITRRREGFPDEKINFAEIRSLRERRRWLIVASAKPYGSMMIPKAVNGFETIHVELAKHHPMADSAVAKTSPLRIVVSLVAYGLCWGPFVFFAASKSVVLAAVLALATLSTGFLVYRAIR